MYIQIQSSSILVTSEWKISFNKLNSKFRPQHIYFQVISPAQIAFYQSFSALVNSFIFICDCVLNVIGLSLIGATVITMGFYTVMWGKAKEVALVEDDNKANNEDANEADLDSPPGSQKAPLLESYKNDEHV